MTNPPDCIGGSVRSPDRVQPPAHLTKYGHDREHGVAYTVFVDDGGDTWTYNPDGENGLLCPCHPFTTFVRVTEEAGR